MSVSVSVPSEEATLDRLSREVDEARRKVGHLGADLGKLREAVERSNVKPGQRKYRTTQEALLEVLLTIVFLFEEGNAIVVTYSHTRAHSYEERRTRRK